jgi:hypothetical protein
MTEHPEVVAVRETDSPCLVEPLESWQHIHTRESFGHGLFVARRLISRIRPAAYSQFCMVRSLDYAQLRSSCLAARYTSVPFGF